MICDTLPELTPEELLLFKCNFRMRTASFGRVVYTAPYRNYLAMACCGPSLWPSDLIRHEDKRLPLDATDFWGLVKQRLGRVRGLPPGQFPLYLKEMELRYNCRNRDLLGVLAKALCAFVPDG